MNTIENNKLIAEFMGGKFRGGSHISLALQDVWLPVHGICRYDTVETGKGKILEYQTSWDWLMPVVEKIEGILNNDEYYPYKVTIWKTGCEIIEVNNDFQIAFNSNPTSKLEATYNAVVTFIKWYNQNK